MKKYYFLIWLTLLPCLTVGQSFGVNYGPELSFSEMNKSIDNNVTETVKVMIDTKLDTVTAAWIVLSYDAAKIEIISFSEDKIMPVVLSPFVKNNGKITIALGVDPEHPFLGREVLGTLKFRSKNNGVAVVSFDKLSAVASVGKLVNTLGSTIPIEISINGSEIAGDFNNDGDINLVDYSIWKKEYLTQSGLISDTNKDGKVDLLDFNLWKNEYIK